MSIFQIIGWVGSISYLASYFLLSTDRLKSNSITYQFMNVLGGICLVISAYESNDNPNLFTNLIWMLIGLAMIFVILKKRRKKKNKL
ncbi:hypothetical protein H9W90_06585 [Polaribacter pectinis]|uniref:CBU-0592-like domain-containing protein n=1 Tax=Polaribacter pectinis TaxID=2738844 RepID=A0A7G9LDT0_9FLAO|nr:hypothetical protein [Polaribacter pectinis]QNM86779.1 hypothetical protein H9W90_06585 [Polaribacter pectinis]